MQVLFTKIGQVKYYFKRIHVKKCFSLILLYEAYFTIDNITRSEL